MTECSFCEKLAPLNECENFPKYVVYNAKRNVYYALCRDHFEVAYRGAASDHRVWNISFQSIVLV